MALKFLLRQADGLYDYVIVDVAPSITLLQTCALVFARNVLIPLDMDMLSVQGAQMAVEAVNMLNDTYGIDAQVIGFLPTQVNHRHAVTDVVASVLSLLCKRTGIAMLPEIRTDQTVHKAARQKQFIFEYDPKCKAAEDYTAAFDAITSTLEARHGQAQKA
jgi:chromosome partitioning protein